MKKSQIEKRNKAFIYTCLILGSAVMLLPFAWMLITAFKSITESTQLDPFLIFPEVWRTDAFVSIVQKVDFVNLYKNTFLMILGRIVCAVLTATMAGYALGRLDFKGKGVAFFLVLFQLMIPTQIFIIPQYLMVAEMGMLDTVFALIFPGMVSAFGTFLLRQSFLTLPKELEEAATLDGCNIGQTFVLIMAPLTRSSMVALGIFTALFAYKDLMWPLVVAPKETAMPLSSALAKLQGQFISNYPELMAASVLAIVPMVVLYLIFQRQFVEGIATSGGKL